MYMDANFDYQRNINIVQSKKKSSTQNKSILESEIGIEEG